MAGAIEGFWQKFDFILLLDFHFNMSNLGMGTKISEML
jgi:hypothetical protein